MWNLKVIWWWRYYSVRKYFYYLFICTIWTIYLNKIKGWKNIFWDFASQRLQRFHVKRGIRSSRHVFNATYSSNGRPGPEYVPSMWGSGTIVDRWRSWVEEGGGGEENKRELSRRQQHHHSSSSTFDCLRSKKKRKKRTSGEDSRHFLICCRHFPYSASSSFPAASLHTVDNILDTYIYNSTGCDSKESRKWHSHTFVFIFRVAKGAKIKRGIDRSCQSSIIQTIASTLT